MAFLDVKVIGEKEYGKYAIQSVYKRSAELQIFALSVNDSCSLVANWQQKYFRLLENVSLKECEDWFECLSEPFEILSNFRPRDFGDEIVKNVCEHFTTTPDPSLALVCAQQNKSFFFDKADSAGLFQKFESLRKPSESNHQALYLATIKKHESVVRILLKHLEQLEECLKRPVPDLSMNLVQLASLTDNVNILQMFCDKIRDRQLLSQGRNDQEESCAPLFLAAKAKLIQNVISLLKAGADLNSASKNYIFKDEMISVLPPNLFDVLKKIDLNKMSHGGTLLHWSNQTEELKLLLEMNLIAIDSLNCDDETALSLSVRESRLDMALLLLMFNASMESGPESLLKIARQNKNESLIKALIAFGCDDIVELNAHFANHSDIDKIIDGIIYQSDIDIPFIPEERTEKERINLLALDGGGIRGIVTAHIAVMLKFKYGIDIEKEFDFIAGTSAGGISGASIAVKKDLFEIRRQFFCTKEKIFRQSNNTEALEQILQQQVGDVNVNEILFPKLLLTATNTEKSPSEIYFIRNFEVMDEDDGVYTPKTDLPLRVALRKTTAAPYYFQNYKEYLDGGLLSNNPTLDLIAQFFKHRRYLQTFSPQSDLRINCVLSLGTGLSSTEFNVDCINLSGIRGFRNILNCLNYFADMLTKTDGCVVDRAREWCISLEASYMRLNPTFSRHYSLNETDNEKLVDMLYSTYVYMCQQKEEILAFKQSLRPTPKSTRYFFWPFPSRL